MISIIAYGIIEGLLIALVALGFSLIYTGMKFFDISVRQALYDTVLSEKLNLEGIIVSNTRHYEALQKASQSLDDVMKGMDTGITSDFIALDIRRALQFLGEISGQISTDDLLENIFGKFCIGK